MIELSGDTITIVCTAEGHDLTLIDRRHGTRWALDPRTLVYGERANLDALAPLAPLRAVRDGATLTVIYRAGAATLEMCYVLHDDSVEIRLPVPAAVNIGCIALPGAFAPEGEAQRLLLPVMQGMLWDGRGTAFSSLRAEGSHLGFTMPFIGHLANHSGLLLVAETADDVRWWLGKDEDGRFWATNLQIASLGTMRYPRVVRLYLTDGDIVAVAKRYRQHVQAQGRFVGWEEKLAARPGLERLFGALMCFIGYCRDDVDYVASARRLKAYGFDRALVYPIRFNVYDPDLRMGGVPPLDLDPTTVAALKALGYDVAPWSWLNEALDGGADGGNLTAAIGPMLRRSADGEVMPHWAIDDQQWYHVCYSFLPAFQQQALNGAQASITWDHFDVLACVPPLECYALDHPNHLGRPLSRSEERAWIREVFRVDQARGLAVSSENFNDAYAQELDVGSVKAWPQYGPWPFWPVPLTMLVYHDSMMHTWWEVHNYNNPWHGRTCDPGQFEYGGGRPRLMAALDALMGCPPDVFPFGAQYAYTGRGKETFLYKFRFGDPEVQMALQAALPVARLHRRIGQQEMVHFALLSEDGCVQESAFADGTRIVANFSQDTVGEFDGVGTLQPESWVVVESYDGIGGR